jgi:hypothetical protein
MVVVLTTRTAVPSAAGGGAGFSATLGAVTGLACFGGALGAGAGLAAILAEAPGMTSSWPTLSRPSGRLLAAWIASTETP